MRKKCDKTPAAGPACDTQVSNAVPPRWEISGAGPQGKGWERPSKDPPAPVGGKGGGTSTVAYGLSLSLESSPGPCGQPFLSQEGHPRPSLACPHLRLRSRPQEGLRAPVHSLPWFLRLPSSVGPARPPPAAPDPKGRPNPSSILGRQPGDLSSPHIFLRPRIGSQPPGGLGHSSPTPFRSPLLPRPVHNPPRPLKPLSIPVLRGLKTRDFCSHYCLCLEALSLTLPRLGGFLLVTKIFTPVSPPERGPPSPPRLPDLKQPPGGPSHLAELPLT